MGYRPLEDIESTLIKFNASEEDTYRDKVQDILKYLRENGYIDANNNTVKGNSTAGQFDLGQIQSPCTIEENFGYSKGTPCVLLKINRVYGWKPEPYDNETDASEAKKATKSGTLPTDSIAVSCEGENDGDIDILGEVTFDPPNGFSSSYFPYLNGVGYRGPLVFAKFDPVKPGVLVQIWCKIWAKNVKHHKNDKGGSVRFELLVDKTDDIK
jgi:sodium/potassium-transporting ATPase subunit beta